MSLHIKGMIQKLRMQTIYMLVQNIFGYFFWENVKKNWGKKKNTPFEGFFIDRQYYNEVRIV